MATHPPWLRFQAYVVGLPKTGSTSVWTMFANYRTAHEFELMELVELAMARARGELDDEQFLTAAGPRLTAPELEMDSTTSHHLYPEVLRDRFPRAAFVHTVRDVRSWVTSLLDMVLRKRIARRHIDLVYSAWETEYLMSMTDHSYDLRPDNREDDSSSVPALMRYWGEHMRTLAEVLPPERSVVVRTTDLASSASDLAALVGIDPATLRIDYAHTNKSPRSLDRFGAFNSPAIRAAYDDYCADIMAEQFPDEHRAWQHLGSAPAAPASAWREHYAANEEWVIEAIHRYGPAAAN